MVELGAKPLQSFGNRPATEIRAAGNDDPGGLPSVWESMTMDGLAKFHENNNTALSTILNTFMNRNIHAEFREKDDTVTLEHNSIASSSRTIHEEKNQP